MEKNIKKTFKQTHEKLSCFAVAIVDSVMPLPHPHYDTCHYHLLCIYHLLHPFCFASLAMLILDF